MPETELSKQAVNGARGFMYALPVLIVCIMLVTHAYAQTGQRGRKRRAWRARPSTPAQTDVQRAQSEEERQRLWRARRELSPALKALAPAKLNHDVVVPKGLIPWLFTLVADLSASHGLLIPCFGNAGDGNIHVNIMADPDQPGQMERARLADRHLLEGVVALGGSISGEHGIGFTKAQFLGLELSPEVIALMRRIKRAFDPCDILNPGKIFRITGSPFAAISSAS